MDQTCTSLLNLADTLILGGCVSFMVFGYYVYGLTYRYLELRDNKNCTTRFSVENLHKLYDVPCPLENTYKPYAMPMPVCPNGNLFEPPVANTTVLREKFSKEQNEPKIGKFIFVNSLNNNNDVETNETDSDTDTETKTNISPCYSPRFVATCSISSPKNRKPVAKKGNTTSKKSNTSSKKCSDSTECFGEQMYVPEEREECTHPVYQSDDVSSDTQKQTN